jgi:hypothetical protein
VIASSSVAWKWVRHFKFSSLFGYVSRILLDHALSVTKVSKVWLFCCSDTETFWCPVAIAFLMNVIGTVSFVLSYSSSCAHIRILFVYSYFRQNHVFCVRVIFVSCLVGVVLRKLYCLAFITTVFQGGHFPTAIVNNVVFIRSSASCAVPSFVTVVQWAHAYRGCDFFSYYLFVSLTSPVQSCGMKSVNEHTWILLDCICSHCLNADGPCRAIN